MVEDVRIVQIIPAPGWCAVYRKGKRGAEFSSPLVCWALVETSSGDRQVVGIDTDPKGTIEISPYANNFLRYELRA